MYLSDSFKLYHYIQHNSIYNNILLDYSNNYVMVKAIGMYEQFKPI